MKPCVGSAIFAGLGARGRRRNELWQIATVIELATDLDLTIRLPPWWYTGVLAVPAQWLGPPGPGDVEVFNPVDDQCLDDRRWMQDARLCWDQRDRVRGFFALKPARVAACLSSYPRVREPGEVAAVHVRLDGYLRFANIHPLHTFDCYRAALAAIPAEPDRRSTQEAALRDLIDSGRAVVVQGDAGGGSTTATDSGAVFRCACALAAVHLLAGPEIASSLRGGHWSRPGCFPRRRTRLLDGGAAPGYVLHARTARRRLGSVDCGLHRRRDENDRRDRSSGRRIEGQV